jgi:hypothetical protein
MDVNHDEILNSRRIPAQNQITSLFFIVWVQYFLGTLFLKDVPIIPLIWAILFFSTIFVVRSRHIIVVIIIYSVFSVFYATGLLFDSTGNATLAYYRIILIWTISSCLIAGIISGGARIFLDGNFSTFLTQKIHFSAIVLLAAWAVFALRDLNAGVVIDHRDIAGTGYLTLSDTFALFSVAYLCREKMPSWEFALVLGLSFTIIFLLGSRTTLLFYPIAVVFLVGKHTSLFGAVAWIFAFIFGAYYWAGDSIDLESGAFFRAQTLFALEADESARVRGQIREQMFARFNESPECFIISCQPEQTHYEHSVLSVIQYFGLAGIIFLIVSCAVLVAKFRFFWRQWYFPILVYCTISLLLSRAWITVTFPVFLAIILAPFFTRERFGSSNRHIQNSHQILRRVEPKSRN